MHQDVIYSLCPKGFLTREVRATMTTPNPPVLPHGFVRLYEEWAPSPDGRQWKYHAIEKETWKREA